MLFEIEQI